jgi:hypothetical protein
VGRFFRRSLIPLVLLAILVALALLSNQFRAVRTLLTLFPRWVIALILGLILVAEVVKIARWRFFVRAAGIPIGWRDAATSQLAGQTASVLNGGDVLRIRLGTEHGIPPRMGVTISFAMWATDMMALPLLALAGIGKQLVSPWILFPPLAIPALLLLVVRSHRFARFVSRILGRFRLTRRYALNEEEIAHVTHLLTRPVALLGGILYAGVMRLIFATTLLCIVNVINDQHLRYDTVLSAHALSALAGVLPGFFAIGSLVELLNARGVPRALGFLISITNRVINVTVNLALGFLILLIRYRTVLTGMRDATDRSAPRQPSSARAPVAPSIPTRAD